MDTELEKVEHILTTNEKLEAWGVGEWVEEPEIVNFVYKGHKCQIYRAFVKHDRVIELGYLCGYLELPKGHVWHSKEDIDIDCDVHGGLTFSQEADADADVWVIGFDCAHSMDICPGTESMRAEVAKKMPHLITRYYRMHPPSYKNVAFVKAELQRLVDQAIEAQSKLITAI